MTNQQLKAHCEDVIANPQDHLDWVVDMAKEALAALTQPASPALKLPDGWVAVPLEPTPGMMVAGTLVSEFQEDPSGMYRAMVAAAPSVPHTAPIAPICATGGAEWVKLTPEQAKKIYRDLDACQKVIHYARGFDPSYVTDAQDCLKIIDNALAAAPEES